MSKYDYTPTPRASSYYERLGISENTPEKEIEKAGKYAFSQYQGEDRDLFFKIRQAREVLVDAELREAYDTFCDQLGYPLGTKAFEDWQTSGKKEDVQSKVSEYRHREQTTRVNPSNSGVGDSISDTTFSNQNTDSGSSQEEVEFEFDGRRKSKDDLMPDVEDVLGIVPNSVGKEQLMQEFDTYVNEYFIPIDDARKEIIKKHKSETKNQRDVKSNEVFFDSESDSFSEEFGWDHKSITIDAPQINYAESYDNINVNIRYWNNQSNSMSERDFDYTDSITERLYLDNFFDVGDVYVDLLHGDVCDKSGDVLDDIDASLERGGNRITLEYLDKLLIVDLSNTQSFYQKLGVVDNVGLVDSTGVDGSDVSVIHDSNHEQGDVLKIDGFYQMGGLLLRLEDGLLLTEKYGSIPDDVYHKIADGGDEIVLYHRGASITVDLDVSQPAVDESQTQSVDQSHTMGEAITDVFDGEIDDETTFDKVAKLSTYYRDRFTIRDYLKGFVVLGLCWPFAEIVQHFYSLSGSSINLFLTAILTIVLGVLFLMAAFIVLYPTLLIVSVLLLVAIPFNLVLPNNPMGLANNGIYHFLFASAVVVYYRFVNEYY